MNFERLQKIISKYTYEQPRILEGTSICSYSPTHGNIQVSNFYPNEASVTDTCKGLQTQLFSELQDAEPTYTFYRTRGSEPAYFFQEKHFKTTHHFLIASRAPLINEDQKELTTEDQYTLFLSNPLVIDPSFKEVGPLQHVQYKPQHIQSPFAPHSIKQTEHIAVELEPGMTAHRPLCIVDDVLVYLSIHKGFFPKPSLELGLQAKGQKPEYFTPHEIISNTYMPDKIKQYARAIKELPLMESNLQ